VQVQTLTVEPYSLWGEALLLAGLLGVSLQILVWCFPPHLRQVLGAALRYAMMCKAVKAQPLLLNDLYTRWYLLMSHTVHSSMVTFAVYTTQFAFSCPLRVWLTSC